MFAQLSKPSPHAFHGGKDQPADPGLRALRLALTAGFDDTETCFRWLYDYGCEPLTPARAGARFAKTAMFSAPTQLRLSRAFQHQVIGNWSSFIRSDLSSPPVFKAYFNPCYDDFQRFVLQISSMLCDPRVAGLKTVTQRWLGLRADKFIVYFTNPDARASWVDATAKHLHDLAPNPTPFTRPWTRDGLVTVATDPADRPNQSWRSTLLRDIAKLVVVPVPPSEKALFASLRETGVDPAKWSRADG